MDIEREDSAKDEMGMKEDNGIQGQVHDENKTEQEN